MKFLKTFLFTISLSFISFGIVTLKGFCASIALDGASSVVQSSVGASMDIMSGFSMDPVGLSILASQAYDSLDNYLYSTYGYDIEDYYNLGIERNRKFQEAVDNTPLVANTIASRLTQGVYTGAALLSNGYQFISHKANQFGNDSKTWFLGKVNQATNTVESMIGESVVKVTSDAFLNYANYLNTSYQNGKIVVFGDSPLCTQLFYYNPTYLNMDSSTPVLFNLEFPTNVLLFTCDSQTLNGGMYDLYCLIPTSYVNNGKIVDSKYYGALYGGNTFSYSTALKFVYSHLITIDGVSYTYGCIKSDFSNVKDPSINYRLGSFTGNPQSNLSNQLNTYLGNHQNALVSEGYVVNYSSATLNTISNLLNQLIGKYVDTATMNQISTIIREIPIETTLDPDTSVYYPEAVVTPDQVAELEALIEEAIALSSDYALLLDDDIVDPEPEPDPDYMGTTVPDDFPSTIFSPLDDSVGSVFDFVSIFEPLFYIFSFSTGLLGLWLVVPFVILFLILFRLLK